MQTAEFVDAALGIDTTQRPARADRFNRAQQCVARAARRTDAYDGTAVDELAQQSRYRRLRLTEESLKLRGACGALAKTPKNGF